MGDDAILSARRIYDGWFDVLQLRVRLHGHVVPRAIVDHPCGAAVLAYDPDRRVAAVVGETRTAVLWLGMPRLTEATAGVAEEGEDVAACARREALEEAGIALRDVESVGAVWMTPSTSTERIYLFLGAYTPADRVGPGGGLAAEHELLHVREEPLAALWAAVERGEMTDAKLFMLLQALRLRRPDLFA
jgi:nudix-type nucleoside diphosphatase (YffH/AdpP family)